MTLALYLAGLPDAGRAPASAALAVAVGAGGPGAARRPAAPGRAPDRSRPRRLPADRRRSGTRPGAAVRRRRPRGRARHLPPATPPRPRVRRGRRRAGRLDAVIAGLLFMAGMRRSEVAALRWADGDPTRPTATASSSPCAGARRNRAGSMGTERGPPPPPYPTHAPRTPGPRPTSPHNKRPEQPPPGRGTDQHHRGVIRRRCRSWLWRGRADEIAPAERPRGAGRGDARGAPRPVATLKPRTGNYTAAWCGRVVAGGDVHRPHRSYLLVVTEEPLCARASFPSGRRRRWSR